MLDLSDLPIFACLPFRPRTGEFSYLEPVLLWVVGGTCVVPECAKVHQMRWVLSAVCARHATCAHAATLSGKFIGTRYAYVSLFSK